MSAGSATLTYPREGVGAPKNRTPEAIKDADFKLGAK